MFRSTNLVGLVAALPLILFALPAAAAENMKVVASFSIIADLARNVGGDRITLTTLVGPNGDAHVYQPKPADAVAVAAARVVLVNGLHFEGFLQRLIAASGTKALVIEVSKGAKILRVKSDKHQHEKSAKHHHKASHEHHHGTYDPHAWHSIPNALVYVKNIEAAFCTADPQGCSTYRANSKEYSERLKALDLEIRTAISKIPEANRTIISSHDAFGYLSHEYKLRFVALQGISTESEASANDVANMIRQVKRNKASAIFVENVANSRLAEQIARETGIPIGGSLYSDALSGQDGPAHSYVEMMRYNVRTIHDTIVGQALN